MHVLHLQCKGSPKTTSILLFVLSSFIWRSLLNIPQDKWRQTTRFYQMSLSYKDFHTPLAALSEQQNQDSKTTSTHLSAAQRCDHLEATIQQWHSRYSLCTREISTWVLSLFVAKSWKSSSTSQINSYKVMGKKKPTRRRAMRFSWTFEYLLAQKMGNCACWLLLLENWGLGWQQNILLFY